MTRVGTNLGAAYGRHGKWDNAAEALEKSLEEYRTLSRRLPGDHGLACNFANTLANLAAERQRRGRVKEAMPLLEEAVRHMTRALQAAPGHPLYRDTAHYVYGRLVRCLVALHEYDAAFARIDEVAHLAPEDWQEIAGAVQLTAELVVAAEADAKLAHQRQRQVVRAGRERIVSYLHALEAWGERTA
jgi:tetratricopeptide (TPR) repeat protein